jgi:glutamate-1-semialdehyde 2,1-aminomutase
MAETGTIIDRARLSELLAAERERFAEEHPGSRARFEAAAGRLFTRVPMTWMRAWPGGFPVYVAEATGATVVDVDRNLYVDFCMGDTGATAGHGHPATVEALERQGRRGITLMLPTDDAQWVAEELGRRFGPAVWQFTLSATDANRCALRFARGLTGRRRILAFNQTYHGSVDDTLAWLHDGRVEPWPQNFGRAVEPELTTKLVEFNDVDALERALAPGDVACVITEPVLTGSGIVAPDPGFHDALRALTREHGTLLVIDETHTLCAGPGGYTATTGLEPDLMTMGKLLAGGIPFGALGMTEEVADRAEALITEPLTAFAGIGGTLAGNALSLAAVHATLEHALTPAAYDRMTALGARLAEALDDTIAAHGLPWHARSLGCRLEYGFRPEPARNNSEAVAARDPVLEELLHLFALNRGVLVCPFHNLAQISVATEEADVDRYADTFSEAVQTLVGARRTGA